ncbi:uncharacterized protein LOC142356511 [Convolutriloba macropyga]|uniref:uncharacterized protein LOC142356511 n=1 Tax=Convolutriloba macropyga TaxID=536237 RepID=UPI003F523AB1
MYAGDSQGLLHCGVLKKSPPEDQMRKRRSWRDRYFTLYRKADGSIHLRYYRTNNKSKALDEMKGSIDMATCLTLESGHTLKGFEKMFSFSIVTPRRTYFLLSKKENEMKEWVAKICESCGFAATSSISPATIRDQLQLNDRMTASEMQSPDTEYNDAFADQNAARRATSPTQPMPSNPNYYQQDAPARSNMSIDLAHRVQNSCSLAAPYETLGDTSPNAEYGREAQYHASAATEYFDTDPNSRLNNQIYGSVSMQPVRSNNNQRNVNNNFGDQSDIYGPTYASTATDGGGGYMAEYGGYGMLPSPNEAPILKSSFAPPLQNINGVNGAQDPYQAQANGGVKGKHEHYLNLLPDKPQVDVKKSPRDEIDGLERLQDQARPPPVDRSAKPQQANVSSPPVPNTTHFASNATSNSHRSLSESRRNKGPGILSLTACNPQGSRNRQLNEVYSSIPLSPVTSFSKKRDEMPIFFESAQPIGLDMPPSPSRISHDSVNSSNSASDAESVSQLPDSVSSTPGSSFNHKSRISSSLPGSAGPTLINNNNKFQWSQKEINYTELAPDSPAYHNMPQVFLGPGGTQYTNINTFNFASAAEIAKPDTASPIQPRLQTSRSLDHTKPGSLTSTPDSKRKEVEYTQVDSDRTQVVNSMRVLREQRMKDKQSPKL